MIHPPAPGRQSASRVTGMRRRGRQNAPRNARIRLVIRTLIACAAAGLVLAVSVG